MIYQKILPPDQKICLDKITEIVMNLWESSYQSEYLRYFDLYDYKNSIRIENILFKLMAMPIELMHQR